MEKELLLYSEIKCPVCGFVKREKMSENSCEWYYECSSCKEIIKPLKGDCCVFCSYGSVKCPPVQINGKCCGEESV